MVVSEGAALLSIVLTYGIYLLVAAAVMRAVWLKTEQSSGRRRLLIRSFVAALLFAPSVAGARVAPFLLAVGASVVLDLIFVRPLTAMWAAKSFKMFASQMLLPFLVTWALILVVALLVSKAKQEK